MTSELVISDQCICQGALLVQVSSSLPITCSNLTKRDQNKMWNMFKVNNKDQNDV